MLCTLQAAGVDLLIGAGELKDISETHSAAIMHSVTCKQASGLPASIPKLYYAYEHYDSAVDCDVLLFPSEFSANVSMPKSDYEILPPGVRSRMLRNTKVGAAKAPFTFGLFSSGAAGRYPMDLVRYLITRVPKGMRMIVTSADGLPAPPRNNSVWVLPRMVDATIKGLQMSDAVIYATAADCAPRYGRTCVEAMAAGLPVVCRKFGAPAAMLADKTNVLMFDNNIEVLDYIVYLHDNPSVREQLAANGQVWASWQDIATQVGVIRGLLKALGA